jgi:hypothetical protein
MVKSGKKIGGRSQKTNLRGGQPGSHEKEPKIILNLLKIAPTMSEGKGF